MHTELWIRSHAYGVWIRSHACGVVDTEPCIRSCGYGAMDKKSWRQGDMSTRPCQVTRHQAQKPSSIPPLLLRIPSPASMTPAASMKSLPCFYEIPPLRLWILSFSSMIFPPARMNFLHCPLAACCFPFDWPFCRHAPPAVLVM
eukprot:352940-Chlamydomonas_euryale.AAC.1